MWSPRERHAVTQYCNPICRLYVIGGFTDRRLQNCGVREHNRNMAASTRESGNDYSCGGGYTGYMSDVWRSVNGIKWSPITLKAPWVGRGGHVAFELGRILFIAGGRTGHSWDGNKERYLSDVWQSSDALQWTKRMDHAEWAARSDMAAVSVPKSMLVRADTVYLFGGQGGPIGNETVFGDTWSWHGIPDEPWVADYNNWTFQAKYVEPDSPVGSLRLKEPMDIVLAADVAVLAGRGVHTIRDLATLGRDDAVALRTKTRLEGGIPNVCDQKNLAIRIVSKCTTPPPEHDRVESALHENASFRHDVRDLAGETVDEQAVRMKFKNERPTRVVLNQTGERLERQAERSDPWEDETEAWDGCSQIGVLTPTEDGGHEYADVEIEGVGSVPQVASFAQTWRIEEELLCRSKWSPRAYTRGVRFQDQVFAIGGYEAEDQFSTGVWYRDDQRPVSSFRLKPDTYSSQERFVVEADEQGCEFDWRMNDWSENRVERNWTRTAGSWQISWLELGFHRLRVRAVDPAGNAEELFEEGRNQHTWMFVPPLPIALILGICGAVLLFGLAVFTEWRIRRRKAAMQRWVGGWVGSMSWEGQGG
jgi:hypothetical protein